MVCTTEHLDWIFRRTDGDCHICWKPLARINYAREGKRGAWEIEHSVPRSKGGTDRLNNLYAAHIKCNRLKSNMTTRTARGWNGKTRAPLSTEKREKAVVENTFLGAAAGAYVWTVFLGPPGWVVGAFLGACFGGNLDPNKTG
jgi:HNH endonuclease